MPGANTTTTVDGVEPTVLVKYVGNALSGDTSQRIDLFPDDEGSPRFIVKGGDAVYITPKEQSMISGAFLIQKVDIDYFSVAEDSAHTEGSDENTNKDSFPEPEHQVANEPAQVEEPQNLFSPPISPGQSG